MMRPRPALLLCAVLTALLLLSHPAASTKETKTYTMQTADGPVTVTETKITEVSKDKSGGVEASSESAWSSGTQELLNGSSVGDMSMGDLGGSLVLAIDKTAVSKGIKKYIMDAIKKLPVATKGIKIGFIEYAAHPYTIVSLKQGWSLDRVMKRLQRELSTKRRLRKGVKIYDSLGLQAAYNELQKFGKATAPRIVVLVSSGKDANAAKTEKWRKKLMKEWISLSEVYVDTSSSSFSVKEGGSSSSGKPLHKGTFLTSLLKSYSHSTIQHYKKIYGEVWEFYIVLKHYKKTHPKDWSAQLKTWFKNKYGSTAKFDTYLRRTNSKVGTISPEVTKKIMFKNKYGSNWKKYFLIWKYKRLFGSAWKTHYEQHQYKVKYGKNWLSEWEKVPFKRKYGKQWEPHYVKWYFKKYRGLTWRYSWVKWQLRQKHKEGSKAYVDEFMRWYYKYTKKGDKAYQAWQKSVKGLTKERVERKFRWFYYNLVFAKRQALTKYTKWLYRKKYGKGFKPKYLAWLAKLKHKSHWKKYYKEYQLKMKYGTEWRQIWYRQTYKKNWVVHYKRFLFKRRYGKTWQLPYERWYFSYKYTDPATALSHYSKWLTTYQKNFYKKKFGKQWTKRFNTWNSQWKAKYTAKTNLFAKYKKQHPKNWIWYYTRVTYKRRYGSKWRIHFRQWMKKHWKKPAPIPSHNILHNITWYKKRYGSKWSWYYTKVIYRRRYGRKWRIHFKKWVKKHWKKPAPTHRHRVVHKVGWFKKRYGTNWRWFYTRILYQHRYGGKWRIHFKKWQRTTWNKPAPRRPRVVVHSIGWYKKRYGANWRWYYTRLTYRRRYGIKWRIHFKSWVKKHWKKPAPTHRHRVVHKITWFKKRYGSKWRWYYTRVTYRRRYGRKWRIHFRRWVKKHWKRRVFSHRPRRAYHTRVISRHRSGRKLHTHYRRWVTRHLRKNGSKRPTIHPLSWFRKRYASNWRWYYTRSMYRIRYGSRWRLHLTPWMKSLERKAKLSRRNA